MVAKVNWLNSLDEGLKQAQKADKAVFLDFFNPG